MVFPWFVTPPSTINHQRLRISLMASEERKFHRCQEADEDHPEVQELPWRTIITGDVGKL